MTARTSSIRSSSVAIPTSRSESPVPRLSNRISQENEARREKNCANAVSQNISFGDKARHEDQIKRAVADHLVGNPHIPATGIPGFRPHHRLLPPLVRAESLQ